MKCNNCNEEIQEHVKVCNHCGMQIDEKSWAINHKQWADTWGDEEEYKKNKYGKSNDSRIKKEDINDIGMKSEESPKKIVDDSYYKNYRISGIDEEDSCHIEKKGNEKWYENWYEKIAMAVFPVPVIGVCVILMTVMDINERMKLTSIIILLVGGLLSNISK